MKQIAHEMNRMKIYPKMQVHMYAYVPTPRHVCSDVRMKQRHKTILTRVYVRSIPVYTF